MSFNKQKMSLFDRGGIIHLDKRHEVVRSYARLHAIDEADHFSRIAAIDHIGP